MKQQINLYKSLSRPAHNWVGYELIIRLAVGYLVLLLLVTCFQIITLFWSGHKAKILQTQYIDTSARFEKQKMAQGGIVDLVQLQQELAAKSALLSLLHVSTEGTETCPQISYYFKSFSLANTSDLWLTRFQIQPDTRYVVLEGATLDPLLVVNWIKELGKTPCFSGVNFSTIDILKGDSDPKSKIITFSLASNKPTPKLVGAK
jgi:hypothetical protein